MFLGTPVPKSLGSELDAASESSLLLPCSVGGSMRAHTVGSSHSPGRLRVSSGVPATVSTWEVNH